MTWDKDSPSEMKVSLKFFDTPPDATSVSTQLETEFQEFNDVLVEIEKGRDSCG